ncbi:MAG: DNA adenine methylase [Candidatus Brocadiaceae bacterium]
MNVLKSPVSVMGGKGGLVNDLIKLIPTHRLFCEPFAGGARLFFGKEPSVIEVLNDNDDLLINLYRVVQNDGKRQELIKKLSETPYSRSIFNYYRQAKFQDEIEKAVQFFYLSKASFAGDIKRGGFACPSRNTTRNPAKTYQNGIDVLEYIGKRLKGVTVECLDYRTCIEKYDSPESFFFCDPPYFSAEHYYGDSFTVQDHYKLSEILHMVKAKVMVSHYSNDLYDRLYNGWYRYEFQSFKGSHKAESGQGKPKTVEVVYCNFEQEIKTRGLFDVLS